MWPWHMRSSHLLLIHVSHCQLIFDLQECILLLMKTYYLFLHAADQTSQFPICPSPFSIHQSKAPNIWVWVVVVKNKCWWSSDAYNSIQVLLHIKPLYGHIIKVRHHCLDWCVSWFQVANVVLMHPYEPRPDLWQTGELVTAFLRPHCDRLSVKAY